MGLLDALQDGQFRADVKRGLLDAGNRGLVGGLLGAPVDMISTALRPLGYNVDAPVGGSEWIGQKLQSLGAVSEQRNPMAEALAGFVDPATMGAGALKALPLMAGMATKGKGFPKIPSMLDDIARTYQETGQIKKLPLVPAVVLSGEEQSVYNAARRGLEPRLASPELAYRGNHHFGSRGPTPQGNGYNNADLMSQLDAVSSQNLGLRTDLNGPALQAQSPRTDAYGKSIRDKMVINVDQSGRGEVYSIVTDGDGLRKGQKVQAAPLVSGDRARPVSDGIRKSASTEPFAGQSMPQPGYSPQYRAALDAGLDMVYEARMKRAADQGAQPGWFHGTDTDVAAFDNGRLRGEKFGHWLTDAPDFAESFGRTVMPLMPTVRNPKIIGADAWNAIREQHARDPVWFAQYRDNLIKQGHDALKVAGGQERLGSFTVQNPSVMAVFDPANIRSVNAAFNPANIGKPDLLGRADPALLPWLGAGALGAAWAGQGLLGDRP